MATYASPLSGGKSSPQGFLKAFSKIFTQSGVIETGSLEVAAQGSPDMTVLVSGSLNDDNAVFILANGHLIQAWNGADATVTIAANSSGAIKTDAVVAYVDTDDYDASNANNPDSLKFKTVRRSGVLTGAPNTGEIEADDDISGNPYIVLAHVVVGNGVGVTPGTSINSGNITNQRPKSTINGTILTPGSVASTALSNTWWEELGRVELSSPASSLSVSIPNRRYLQIIIDAGDASSGGVHQLRFNNDSGSNYAYKRSTDGGTATDSTEVAQLDGGINVSGLNKFSTAWVNNSTNEKVVMLQAISSNNSGATTAPRYANLMGKWVNANPITTVSLHRAANNYSAGSRIIVLGHD